MLRILFTSVLVFSIVIISSAQIRATTESGNKVLLLDNGTWQYDEKVENTSAVEVGVIIVPSIAVDSSRDINTEPEELFYLPSPRLVKYFGESGGNIRCKLSSSNNLGSVKIHFVWEIPVVDGNKYFGTFKEGTKVIFTMLDGQKVALVMGDENIVKRLDKHNFSLITNNSYPLTNEQLTVLTTQPIRKMEVDWKKKAEEYDIEKSHILQETLPTVL